VTFSGGKLLSFVAHLPPCVIGVEACWLSSRRRRMRAELRHLWNARVIRAGLAAVADPVGSLLSSLG